jgi:radical SAM protein
MKFEERPFIAIWEMTQACDLLCKHCRATARPDRDARELSTDEARCMLDNFANAKVPLVIFTGGDPAKRADLVELVRYGSDRGLHVGLTPSATPLVTDVLLGRLRDAGLKRLAMSLDGLHAEVHDKFRGRSGSFIRTLEILESASNAGLTTQINTTLHEGTINALPELAKTVEKLGVDLWSVFTIVPTGRATTTLMPGASAIEGAFEQLLQMSKTVPFAIKTTAGPHYRRLALEEKRTTKTDVVVGMRGRQAMWVNEGRGFLFISHQGQVFPSGFLPLSCGDVRRKDPIAIYREHETFLLLRDSDSLKGKCGTCNYRQVCGGARARAYAMTGDLMESDPLCAYVPEDYVGAVDIFEGSCAKSDVVHLPIA